MLTDDSAEQSIAWSVSHSSLSLSMHGHEYMVPAKFALAVYCLSSVLLVMQHEKLLQYVELSV